MRRGLVAVVFALTLISGCRGPDRSHIGDDGPGPDSGDMGYDYSEYMEDKYRDSLDDQRDYEFRQEQRQQDELLDESYRRGYEDGYSDDYSDDYYGG